MSSMPRFLPSDSVTLRFKRGGVETEFQRHFYRTVIWRGLHLQAAALAFMIDAILGLLGLWSILPWTWLFPFQLVLFLAPSAFSGWLLLRLYLDDRYYTRKVTTNQHKLRILGLLLSTYLLAFAVIGCSSFIPFTTLLATVLVVDFVSHASLCLGSLLFHIILAVIHAEGSDAGLVIIAWSHALAMFVGYTREQSWRNSFLNASSEGAPDEAIPKQISMKRMRRMSSDRSSDPTSPSVHNMEIDDRELIIPNTDPIGRGGSSQVYKGVFRGLTVAVKVLRCSILEDADTRGFRQEMSLLSYLQHPHICLFIGYRLQPALSVVMEFCGGGDLGEAARTMPVLTRVSKLMETALGLCYLHGFKTPVVHGDIKPSNLLLDEFQRVKICDFGMARVEHRFADRKAPAIRMQRNSSHHPATRHGVRRRKRQHRGSVTSGAGEQWLIMHGDTSCDEGSSSSSESEYSGSFIAADGPEDPALGLDLNTQHDFPAFGNSGSLESSRREEQARTLPLPTVFSAPYAAPELFMSRQFDERVDIFSFGLVMWEVFAGSVPYSELSDMGAQVLALKVANSGLRPEPPVGMPQPLVNLMRQCWSAIPTARPSAMTILLTLRHIQSQLPSDPGSGPSSARSPGPSVNVAQHAPAADIFKFPSPAHSTQAVHGDPFQTPLILDTKSPHPMPASAPPTMKSLNRTVSESVVSEMVHRLLSPKNHALTYSSPSFGGGATVNHGNVPSDSSERSLALMDLTVNTNIPFPGFDGPEVGVSTFGSHISPEAKAMTDGGSKSPRRSSGGPPMLARASSEGTSTPQQSSSKSLQSASTQKTSSSAAASSHSPFALPPQAVSFPETTILPASYSVKQSGQALSSAVEPSPPRLTSMPTLPDARTAHISPRGAQLPRSDSPLSDIESDSDMTEITTMTQETSNTYSVLTPLSARPVTTLMVRGASVPKLNLSIPLAPQLSMKESRDSKVSMVSSFTGDSSVVSGSEYDYTEDDEDLSTTDHDLDNDSTNSRSFSGLSDLSSRLGGLSLSAQSSPHKWPAPTRTFSEVAMAPLSHHPSGVPLPRRASSFSGADADEIRLASLRPVIKSSFVHIGDNIGTGRNGDVYAATLIGQSVVVKRFDKTENPKTALAAKQSFLQEAYMMMPLRHPNILPFLGVVIMDSAYLIVMPLLRRGSLDKNLYVPDMHMSLQVRLNCLHGVAKGLHYLHSQSSPIIHRDLKSANVLADVSWHCVISDFGLTRFSDTDVLTQCGTFHFIAPEIMRGEAYGEKVDVYSFGVLIAEVVTRKRPYGSMSSMATWNTPSIRTGLPDTDIALVRQAVDPKASVTCPVWEYDDAWPHVNWAAQDLTPAEVTVIRLCNLARRCFNPVPGLRPSAAVICDELKGLKEDIRAESPKPSVFNIVIPE